MAKTEKAIKKVDAAEIAPAAPTLTVSERFAANVEREFKAQLGAASFTATEKRLVQHLYVAVDQALRAAEEKRTENMQEDQREAARDDARAFIWKNVNLPKLAIDTVNRISLGLDALMPNHLHPLPFFNTRTAKYDLLLLTGFAGLDHVARRFAADPILTIRYELVHATDTFRALPRSSTREIEGYAFDIDQPFDRGQIIGGFGYIEYDDPRKNRLVIVTPRDFARAKAVSKGGFWGKHDIEMHYKTVVRRVAGRILLDATRVPAQAIADVMSEENDMNDPLERVAIAEHQHGNARVIDVEQQEPQRQTRRKPQDALEAEPEPAAEPEVAEQVVDVDEQPAPDPGF